MAQNLSWDNFGRACDDLVQQVRTSGFQPEVVITVARGGLIPGGALAYALGVELVDTINVERAARDGHNDPVLLAPMVDAASIAGRQVLIVDDITDSGRTLGLVTRLLRGFGADVRSAVLYSKPQTIFAADYRWSGTDEWVQFPWSPAAPTPEEARHG